MLDPAAIFPRKKKTTTTTTKQNTIMSTEKPTLFLTKNRDFFPGRQNSGVFLGLSIVVTIGLLLVPGLPERGAMPRCFFHQKWVVPDFQGLYSESMSVRDSNQFAIWGPKSARFS